MGSLLRNISKAVILGLCFFTPLSYADTPAPAPAPAVASVDSDVSAATDSRGITLDFKEADINTVLRVMSLKSKVNIVAGPEVHGNVTIRLENVPWEKALQVVLRTYGYVYERDGNIIRVTTRENLAAEPLVTQTFILNYTKASEVQAAVQDILTERGRIKTAERTNTLIVTDVPTNLYTISEVLKKLDKPTPEAFIDSRIINTSLGSAENMGIEWKTGGTSNNVFNLTGAGRPVTFPFPADPKTNNEYQNPYLGSFFPLSTATTSTPTGGTFTGTAGTNASGTNTFSSRFFPISASPSGQTYTFGTLSFSSFSAVLQMLKTRSNTKVISNPRIVVLNNQTASIHVGDNIPLPTFDTNSQTGRLVVSGFNYDKLKTGVTMDVTPHINSNEEILVDLQPSVNSQGSTLSFNSDLSAPIINETTAKTQVLISSGETIAIGGLMTDNVSSTEAKVPYLGDIPLVGKLFRSKRQTSGSGNAKVETLFFVTVSIVDSQGQPAGARVKSKGAKKVAHPPTPAAAASQKVESKSQPASPSSPASLEVEPTSGAPKTNEVPQEQKAA